MSIGTGLGDLGAWRPSPSTGGEARSSRSPAIFETTRTAVLARLIDVAAIAGGLLIAGFGAALLNAAAAVSRHRSALIET